MNHFLGLIIIFGVCGILFSRTKKTEIFYKINLYERISILNSLTE